MAGEADLSNLIKHMTPKLNPGEYVFTSVKPGELVDASQAVCFFKEEEGRTLIFERREADRLNLAYDFVAAWITLQVHSSLEAVGLTAAFSSELARHRISCNVVAGYYHDHIFVKKSDQEKAITMLKRLSEG